MEMFGEMASTASQFVIILFWIIIAFMFAWEIVWLRQLKKAKAKR